MATGGDRTLRRIQGLYAKGPVGGLGDAELLERFLVGDGLDREDAFAALVRRHGPMVLAVCRRMLGGPNDQSDADDAFQAVFLVLARRAGSLRRPGDLRPWLYGVAVKTGKEARRRSVKLRTREGTGLDADRPAAAIDPDLFDLRAALDEELARLPGRYREPLLLCELEGASRRDAAERLGLAEGTLSSRLARGRSLLRDRLARRGLAVGALGAALAPGSTSAAGLAALVDGSVRLALISRSVNSAGVVPAAVEALSEGVLVMLAVRWKTTFAATLAAVTLTAGLAWGFAAPAPLDERPTVPAAVEEPRPAGPRPIQVRGVVVDETGSPVAGAEVFLNAHTTAESHTTTAADGSYTMTAVQPWVDWRSILARTPDGRSLGLFKYGGELTRAQAEAPARVVLKPGREIVARVTSPAGEAVAEAEVEVVGDHNVVARATTGADGQARLIVPVDGLLKAVAARKGAVGFGGMIFGPAVANRRMIEGVKVDAIPASVAVALEPPHAVRIKAVDEAGDPIVGVRFHLPRAPREGDLRDGLSFWSRMLSATTGPDGVAVFDWLPKSRSAITFFSWSKDDRYAERRIDVPVDHEGVVEARMEPSVPIRGRVLLPDGAPAKDVRVRAMGSGRGMDTGSARARTDDDGGYVMHLPPEQQYIVWAQADGLDAEPRHDLIARVGRPLEGVDFRLAPGTVLRGVATTGPDDRPSADERIHVRQVFDIAPEEFRRPGDLYAMTPLARYLDVRTDAEGRYAMHLVPGTYRVSAGVGGSIEERRVVIAGEPEVRLNLHRDRPETGAFSGRVVGPEGKPVAGAVVEVAPAVRGYGAYSAPADADGRFEIDRDLVATLFRAQSPDGGLAGITEVGPDEAEAELKVAPVATASGVLLNQAGEPAAGVSLWWGCRIHLDRDPWNDRLAFGPRTTTDDQGRFTLPSLVVGQSYEVRTVEAGTKRIFAINPIRPEKPGPIDLGRVALSPLRER